MRQLGARRKVWFSAWVRALAGLAALLVAGEHGFASLHQALTAHEVCAEHGELVHAGDEHARAVSHGSIPSVESGATAEAEHHHCGVVPAAPTRAPAVRQAPAIAEAELARAESFESFAGVLSSPDVLAFAPKQSPPAA